MSAQTPILVVYVAGEEPSACSSLVALSGSEFSLRRADSPDQARGLAGEASLVLLAGWFDGAAAFCQQFRADPATAGVPILLLDDREPGSSSGEPDAFLPRSASPAHLTAQVRLLLRLRQAERATDVAARLKMEQALRDTQGLYHSLVETLPVCIFRKDLQGRFTFVNRPFCIEMKRTESEMLGRCDRDFYPEDLALKYTRDDRLVTTTGADFECIEAHITPEGKKCFVQVVKSPLRDAAGQVIGMQGVFWDVTDRKSAQEELARTTADIHVVRRVQKKLFPSASSALVREAAAAASTSPGRAIPSMRSAATTSTISPWTRIAWPWRSAT